jgi:GNAT superfamily N-acetyltransferase
MTGSPLLQRYGMTLGRARSSLLAALRARDQLVVALEDGEPLGLAWVITTRALDHAAYLRLLLVAEGQRSHGLGAALLADAERRARASGCRHLVLLVTTANRRARTFYARHGYRHVGNLPGFVRPAIGESLYVKSWTATPATAGVRARVSSRRRRSS